LSENEREEKRIVSSILIGIMVGIKAHSSPEKEIFIIV
jgi:hypothetical protein